MEHAAAAVKTTLKYNCQSCAFTSDSADYIKIYQKTMRTSALTAAPENGESRNMSIGIIMWSCRNRKRLAILRFFLFKDRALSNMTG